MSADNAIRLFIQGFRLEQLWGSAWIPVIYPPNDDTATYRLA